MKKCLLVFSVWIFALGCEKDESDRCEDLQISVKGDDVAKVKEIVTRLAADLSAAAPTSQDPSGHYNNYLTLIERLEDECDVEATGLCYGCVQTLPEQSEIKLVVPLGTHSVTRVIDIAPDQSGKLVCVNMHE